MAEVQRVAGAASTMTTIDDLLMREMHHRMANEIMVAVAALRLAQRSYDKRTAAVVEEAVIRLQAFADLNRLLASPMPGVVDVSGIIQKTSRALLAHLPGENRLILHLDPVSIDGRAARWLALIAAELITNALRHALTEKSGCLTLILRTERLAVALTVIDDGKGMTNPDRSGGLGRAIVEDLASRAGATVETVTGPDGTSIKVSLPLMACPPGAVPTVRLAETQDVFQFPLERRY